MVLKNLFGGKSRKRNQRSKQGGNPEWVLPAALLLGQKVYHSSSKACVGNKRHKKRSSKKSRKNKRSGRSRRR